MRALSATQRALIDKMKAGYRVYNRRNGKRFQCLIDDPASDRCTPTVLALEGRGLLKRINETSIGCEFKLTEDGNNA